MTSQLDQLRGRSIVVADTGDIQSIEGYKPTDATTNPSLLFKASDIEAYQSLLFDAIEYAKNKKLESKQEVVQLAALKAGVNFGIRILEIVPGVVSTEVSARYAFDTQPTIRQAREIIALYHEAGMGPERVLIKIPSTWEGIQACKILEAEGIHCNMTLIFSFAQAVAAAESGATLISPFIGRIRDWYMNKKMYDPENDPTANEDPGVISVKQIYNYYKKFDIQTIVMGASFRSKHEVLALVGCDKLTIAPKLLDQLEESTESIIVSLSENLAKNMDLEKVSFTDENQFRWSLNTDAMATEKLAEGIRLFYADEVKLQNKLMDMMS